MKSNEERTNDEAVDHSKKSLISNVVEDIFTFNEPILIAHMLGTF